MFTEKYKFWKNKGKYYVNLVFLYAKIDFVSKNVYTVESVHACTKEGE